MKYLVLALALLAALASVATAATVSYGPVAVPLSTTNWGNSVYMQQFNPAFGTLNSITFYLDGHVEGAAKFESLDASPTTVTMDLSAILRLKRPDYTDLVVTIPVVSTVDAVTAFDGGIDFGGTSGATHANLAADKQEFAVTSAAADKALFTGTGTILLPVVASGVSSGSGAGNLIQQFQTLASASAWVTYDYTAVPEPSSLLALMSGAGLIGFAIRRRK